MTLKHAAPPHCTIRVQLLVITTILEGISLWHWTMCLEILLDLYTAKVVGAKVGPFKIQLFSHLVVAKKGGAQRSDGTSKAHSFL